MTTSQTWRDSAACIGEPSDIFYGLDHGGRDHDGQARAMALCGGCPVKQDCLRFAMECEQSHSRYGIWGGLTADERQSLSRRQRVAA